MKNLMYIFLLTMLCPKFIFSQCVGNINTPLGSTINNWDWTIEKFEVYVLNSTTNTISNLTIDSPFFLDGFVNQPNTNHLGASTFQDSAPEDGWELILRNFGTSTQGVRVPFFLLYNRFSGKLRAFHYLTSPDNIDEIETTLSFFTIENVITHINASLENSFLPMDAIENYLDKSLTIETLNLFQDNGGIWLLADIPTTYDPCTCKYSSGLIFMNRSINTQNITLSIEGGGIIEQIINSSGVVSSSALNFKNFNINNLQAGVKKGTQAYKSTTGLLKDVDKQLAKWFGTNSTPSFQSQVMNALGISEINDNNIQEVLNYTQSQQGAEAVEIIKKATKSGPASILPQWLKDIVPYGGALAGFIDFFIARPSPQPQPMRFAANLNFIANGSITDVQDLQSTSFLMPGANQQNVNPNLLPIYQNPLGVINLVEQPVLLIAEDIEIIDDEQVQIEYAEKSSFKLGETLKYAINPASGLTLNNIKAAIYFRGCAGANESLIQAEEGLWRTPYMSLACLEDYSIVIDYSIFDTWSVYCYLGNPYLHLVAEFDKSTIMQSYKFDMVDAPYKVNNTPANPFLNIPEVATVSNFNLDNPPLAWNEIVVQNEIVITDENRDKINQLLNPTKVTYSYDPLNGEFVPNLEFSFAYPDGYTISAGQTFVNRPNCGANLPLPSPSLEKFCSDSDSYNPEALSLIDQSEVRESENLIKTSQDDFKLKVYPNPVQSTAIVEFNLDKEEDINIALYNLLGQEVKTFYSQYNIASGEHRLELDMNGLTSGNYIFKLQTSTKKEIVKITKH